MALYYRWFFIPLIYFIGFLKDKSSINDYKLDIWQKLFNQSWQNMAAFLLPMGVILASSLITQIEYKNNTWKQLHATPQTYTNIFIAKFSVIILMTIKFFIFFVCLEGAERSKKKFILYQSFF